MPRRHRIFAAPLVVTFALAPACQKEKPEPKHTNPPKPREDMVDAGAVAVATPDAAPAQPPAAPPGTAVLERGSVCRTRDGTTVACPPTIIAPDPASRAEGRTRIRFDEGSFACETSVPVNCKSGAKCNPPRPKPAPCPDDLLPALAAGIEPTSRTGDDCFLGDVEVKCPVGDSKAPPRVK